MSYRAFKRLLGESSLERKCRFLLGAGTLVLITASFWIYARQTESLAYETTAHGGRLLIPQIIADYHVEKPARGALREFQEHAEKLWPEALASYKRVLYKPLAKKSDHKPETEERDLIEQFRADPDKHEATRLLRASEKFYYYGAVRASPGCLTCHPRDGEREEWGDLTEGSLMAVVRITLNSRAIEEGVHLNRAILISTALVTSLLIMAGSYVIVRYVIVKPVKHLKEVSDAISAGQLNVRSEIQTGDEFEDLSYAFNRMLRNLVSVQDRLKEANGELDNRVEELARANLALFESNKVKGDFLATISHELRTPLHSILGFSDVLAQAANLNDKQIRWATNIRTSGQQLLGLINDLLDLAKIEAGKMELKPERFDFAELAEGQVANLRPLAEKKSLDLRADIDDNLPPLLQDAGKLRQILSNLLSNALKFTPEGGRVTLKAVAEGPMLVVTVSDTGVGIAPEDQERVFEKFRQAGTALTREHEGTGLGLSIVRELAGLLGGDVNLHSELGRGSTFTVRVPLRSR